MTHFELHVYPNFLVHLLIHIGRCAQVNLLATSSTYNIKYITWLHAVLAQHGINIYFMLYNLFIPIEIMTVL